MSSSFDTILESIRGGAGISDDDILQLRKRVWSDGKVSPEEAETLFELNDRMKDRSAEWTDFFVEALNEYVVNQLPPRGYIDEPLAGWLMAKVDHDGHLESMAELELVAKVLETALGSPPSLKSYAIRQIETAVLEGSGPTRRGTGQNPGQIDGAEVALLRRLLFAPGGDGALMVSREEADLLWRLKEATLNGDNAPEWKTLFVQGVGNYLMAYSSYRPLERAEAARLEAFVNDHDVNVARFLSRMGSGSGAMPGSTLPAERSREEHVSAVAASNAITDDEAAWLQSQSMADGQLDEFELALLEFVRSEDRQTSL